MTTPEEAKFWRDKQVLESAPNMDKGTATMGAGVDPENYDKIKGKPQSEIDIEDAWKAYLDMLEIFDYYMDMPEDEQKFLSMWIIGTYMHEKFPSYPFLFINAMRGSGKTRLLKLISHLACGGAGQVSTQPTDSVLYRTPKHSTLVFDECEGIGSKEKASFRQYLNASYKKGGIVQRAKKVKKKEKDRDEENYEIENFEPYKPIVMANIWGMEEVLGDRCLTLVLQKSDNPAKTKIIEDFENNYTIEKVKFAFIRAKCSLCSVVTEKHIYSKWNSYIKLHYALTTLNPLTTQTTLSNVEENFFEMIDTSGIDGRNLELIFPILVTARIFGNENFLEILKICKKLISSKREEEISESKDVSLIDFVANYLDINNFQYFSINDLTRNFRLYLNDAEEVDDKWLNAKWMGRALKRLDLVLDKRRIARGNEVSLNKLKAIEKMKMFKKESASLQGQGGSEATR